jgi:hypothetical protein
MLITLFTKIKIKLFLRHSVVKTERMQMSMSDEGENMNERRFVDIFSLILRVRCGMADCFITAYPS